MKIKELSQALNKIERYEDDIYDIILCVKRDYDDCRMGYLIRSLSFDSIESILIKVLNKENCLNDNAIIEFAQGVIYKSDLYITVFLNTHAMLFSENQVEIYKEML